MATTNSISSQATVAEHPPANLLVMAAAMPLEEFEGVMVNLAEAFSAETLIVAAHNEHAAHGNSPLRVVSLPQSNTTWTLKPADFINAYEIAREHNVRAIVMLSRARILSVRWLCADWQMQC